MRFHERDINKKAILDQTLHVWLYSSKDEIFVHRHQFSKNDIVERNSRSQLRTHNVTSRGKGPRTWDRLDMVERDFVVQMTEEYLH